MIIKGMKNLKYEIDVELHFGETILELKLEPIPLGFQENLACKLVEPEPPFKNFIREKGKLVKNPDNKQFLKEYDTKNIKYLEEKSKYEQRLNIALTYEALKKSQEIDFETKFDNSKYLESLDKITEELIAFGFLPVHLFQIIKAVTEVNVIEDLENEKKS